MKQINAKNYTLIGVGILIVILACTFLLGNGHPLPIPGYEGDANTTVWLKVIDMWLYTIYILLGLVIMVLVGGIIWSYFKKNK